MKLCMYVCVSHFVYLWDSYVTMTAKSAGKQLQMWMYTEDERKMSKKKSLDLNINVKALISVTLSVPFL